MKQKIAVCLSGQSRTWEFCVDTIKSFLKETEEYTFDFFIHTWNYNTYPRIYLRETDDISDYTYKTDIENYIKSYEPKKYKVDSFENFENKRIKLTKEVNYKEFNDFNLLSSMYSFKRSILLKIMYERQNNFKYDYVIKLRPDLFFLYDTFSEHLNKLKNSSETNSFTSYFGFQNTQDLNDRWNPDLYWIFKSDESYIYSSFFNEKIKYDLKNKNTNNYYTFNRHIFNLKFNPINLGHPIHCYDIDDILLFIIRPYHLEFLDNDFFNSNREISKTKIVWLINWLLVFFESESCTFNKLLSNYNLIEEFKDCRIDYFFKKNNELKQEIIKMMLEDEKKSYNNR